MSVCIFKSNPDYQNLVKGSTFTEDTVDFIIQQYWLEHPDKAVEGKEEYPSIDYVNNFFKTATSKADGTITIKLWRMNDRKEYTFDSKEDAVAKQADLISRYGDQSVMMWTTKDGKYHVKVPRPLVESEGRNFQFNREQKYAIATIADWFMDRAEGIVNDNWVVLEGEAGTGKTSIISDILLNCSTLYGSKVVTGAVSNQATDNIIEKLSDEVTSQFEILRKTVASMIGLKQDTSKEEKGFVEDPWSTKDLFNSDIAIIDEASMITEQFIDYVKKAAERGIPVLFIGDAAQINPIREGDYFKDHPELKKDQPSPVFISKDEHLVVALKERVRQGEGSPILELASAYRNAWENNTPTPTVAGKKSSADGRLTYTSKPVDKLLEDLVPVFQEAIRTGNPNLIHIVPFNRDYDTSGNVRTRGSLWWNMKIYDALHPEAAGTYVFQPGDLVRFDDSYQFDEDTLIPNSENAQVVKVSDVKTDERGMPFREVTIKLSDGRTITVPVIGQDAASQKQWKEVLTKWRSTIYNSPKPLQGKQWQAYWEYNDHYAKLIFSYALNVHRAQGSTYDITVLDQDNFDSVKALYQRSGDNKQFASLSYTAATRAKNILVVASQQAADKEMKIDLLATNKLFNEARNKKPIVIAKPESTESGKQLNSPQPVIPDTRDTSPFSIIYASQDSLRDKPESLLSNLHERPFTPGLWTIDYATHQYKDQEYPNVLRNAIFTGTIKFKSVEGAFQAAKLAYSKQYTDKYGVLTPKGKAKLKEFQEATGYTARKLGQKENLLGLDSVAWDAVSSDVMYRLLRESFLQNPDVLEVLAKTKYKTLRHPIPDGGKANFIGNLTKIRDEFRDMMFTPIAIDTTSPLGMAVYRATKTIEAARSRRKESNTGTLPKTGTVDASVVLYSIADGSYDSNATLEQKTLALALLPLIKRLSVKVTFDDRKNPPAAGSTYHIVKDKDIIIYTKSNKVDKIPSHTILHEITHALTITLIDSDKDFRKGINELREYVINYIKQNAAEGKDIVKEYFRYDDASGDEVYKNIKIPFDIYALSTPSEFLAESMASTFFQDILKQIPAPEEKQLSVWDKIVKFVTNAFSKLFSQKHKTSKSVYDDLMPVIAYAMEAGSYSINRTKGEVTSKEATKKGLEDTQLQEAADIIQLRSPEAFAGVSESQQTINSDKTILSNEELKYWNEKGVGDKPRILVGSEHSDPAFHVKEILDVINGTRTVRSLVPINKEEWETLPASERRSSVKNDIVRYYKLDTPVTGHDFAGLYLITKHDGLPMLDLLQTKIPKLIHFSITTLGGTEYEPGVMKYNDLLDRIEDYLKQGLDPESVTIRIDPIVPGVTNFNDIEEVVRRASAMGIKRIRFSVMDAYPETVREMTQRNYNFEEYYGLNKQGNPNFTAKKEYIGPIYDLMLQLKDKYGVTVGTCAEFEGRVGISKEGCLSVNAVNNMLGLSMPDLGTQNNQQRALCSCYGGKVDALAYGDHCASHCVYCYAKHANDKALQYYNEDGTLKDNNFTRTRREQTLGELEHLNSASGYFLHSGGAVGADTLWDEVAAQYGIPEANRSHYYYGRKTPKGNVSITEEQYKEGVARVERANRKLKRNGIEKYMDLLSRNWQQAKNADAVFAIAPLDLFGNVSGGTAWAVQMAIDEGKPVYVWDGQWYTWSKETEEFIPYKGIPTLTKNFAGIGSTDVQNNPDLYRPIIEAVFNQTFTNKNHTATKDIEKPKGNMPQQPVTYYMASQELSDQDKRLFNAGISFTPILDFKDKEIREQLKEDIVTGKIPFGTKITIEDMHTVSGIIEGVKILDKTEYVYRGTSTPIDITEFSEEEVARLQDEGIGHDDNYVYVPTYSAGISERELVTVVKADRIKSYKLLTPTEIRAIGVRSMWKLSDIVTKLQTGGSNASRTLLKDIDGLSEKDFTGMSRIEIINTITPGRLLDIVKDTLFSPVSTDKPKDVAKKQFIRNNFDLICEQAQDFLAKNEEITLTNTAMRVPSAQKEDSGIVSDILDADAIQEVLEQVGSSAEHWQVGFRQVSAVSSLASMVRRNLAMLLDLDEKGYAKKDMYGPKLLDVHQAVLDMLNWVSGAKNSDDMINILQKHLPNNPWLAQLVGVYREDGDPNGDIKEGILLRKENGQLKSRFYTNFSKYFQPYVVMYKTAEGTTMLREINTTQFSESIINDLINLDSHKNLGHLTIWDKEGGLSKAFDDLDKLVGKTAFKDRSTGTVYPATGLRSASDKVTDKNLIDFKKCLEILDIPSPRVEELRVVFPEDSIEAFKKAVERLYYITDGIRKRASAWEQNHANEFTLFGGNNSIKTNISELLKILSPVLHTNIEAVSYEAGKMHYGYVQPSYLNMHIADLKGLEMNDEQYQRFITDNFKNYDGWFYTDASSSDHLAGKGWLNEWLELLETDRECRDMLTHVASLSFEGTGYVDKINPQMGASLLEAYFYDTHSKWAYYRVLLLSNKPSEEYIRFVRFTKDYRKHITDNVFERTLWAEINRIRTVRERLAKVDNGTLSKDVLIDNLETGEQNGLKFYFLKFLNDEMERGTTLGNMTKQLIDGTLSMKVGDKSYIDYKYVFSKVFNEYMEGKFHDMLDSFEKDGTITRDTYGTIKAVYGVQDKIGTHARAEENLREFMWNDWYAQVNMQQILFGDPAQYVNAEDLQKRAAELHAPGVRPDISALDIKTGRKVTDGFERFAVLDDIILPSSAFVVLADVHKKILSDPKFSNPDGTLTKLGEEKSKLLKKIRDLFEEDNVTDGQAVISPSGLRKIMHIFGKWDMHMNDIYDRLVSGEDVSNKEFDVVWPIIKPFSYSTISMRTESRFMPFFNVGVQQKNSMFPIILAAALSRSVGVDNVFTALYDVMEETADKGNNNAGLDAILFASNLKTGKHGSIDISQMAPDEVRKILRERIKQVPGQRAVDGTQRKFNEDYVYEIPWKDWAQQQEITPHFEGYQQIGSQIRGLAVADTPNTRIDEAGKEVENEITINLLGKDTKMTVAQAKKMYFEAHAKNIDASAQSLAEELSLNTSNKKLRNIALSRMLTDELRKDGRYGFDMIRAVSVDRNGEFTTSLSDPMLAGVLQQMMNSLIKNRVYKQQIAGGPLVQVSSFGLSKELNIVYSKDKTRPLYAEVMISAPEEFYQHKEFLNDRGELDIALIEKHCPKALEMLGYRIPTEAKYSTLPMKVVGFLPRGTESIMLPKEITVLSGSDFDVDKLYIMRQVFEKKNGVFTTDVTSQRDRSNNIILDIAWAFITSELNTDQTISAGQFDALKTTAYSIAAVDNKNPEDVLAFLKTLKDKSPKQLKLDAYKASDLLFADTQIRFFHQNMVAAKLIGVFAQANMSHAFVSMMRDGTHNPYITLPDGIKMRLRDKNGTVHEVVKNVPIDEEFDWTGLKRISAEFAECIGASVDAVKDPVFNYINVNMVTVNVFSTMMRLGWDTDTLGWFLTTPIIKELVKQYEILNAEGNVTIGQVISKMKTELENGRHITYDEKAVWGIEEFQKYHNLPVVPVQKKDEADDTYMQRQLRERQINWQLLELFDQMQGIADITRSLVHVTRINSISSAPGPFASNTFVDNIKTARFFTMDALKGVRDVFENPVIFSFWRNTQALVQKVLGDNMVQAGPLAAEIYERMEALYGYIGNDMAQEMSEFMASYFANWDTPIYDLSQTNRRQMILAFPNRFKELKLKYPDNVLIQSIQYKINDSGNPYLELKTKGLQDEDMAELKAAWDTLLRKEDERLASGNYTGIEGENLALKLVEYNFFRGGFGFDSKTFTRIVPESVKDRIPYYRENVRRMSEINPDDVDFDNLIMQYMLNTGRLNMPTVDASTFPIKRMETGGMYVTEQEGNKALLKPKGIVAVRTKGVGTKYYYVEYSAEQGQFNLTPVAKLGGRDFAFEIDPHTPFIKMVSGFTPVQAEPKPGDQTPEDSVNDLHSLLVENPQRVTTTRTLMTKILGENWKDAYRTKSDIDTVGAFKAMTDKFFYSWQLGFDNTGNDSYIAQELSKINFNLSKNEVEDMMVRVIKRLDEQNICR